MGIPSFINQRELISSWQYWSCLCRKTHGFEVAIFWEPLSARRCVSVRTHASLEISIVFSASHLLPYWVCMQWNEIQIQPVCQFKSCHRRTKQFRRVYRYSHLISSKYLGGKLQICNRWNYAEHATSSSCGSHDIEQTFHLGCVKRDIATGKYLPLSLSSLLLFTSIHRHYHILIIVLQSCWPLSAPMIGIAWSSRSSGLQRLYGLVMLVYIAIINHKPFS